MRSLKTMIWSSNYLHSANYSTIRLDSTPTLRSSALVLVSAVTGMRLALSWIKIVISEH